MATAVHHLALVGIVVGYLARSPWLPDETAGSDTRHIAHHNTLRAKRDASHSTYGERHNNALEMPGCILPATPVSACSLTADITSRPISSTHVGNDRNWCETSLSGALSSRAPDGFSGTPRWHQPDVILIKDFPCGTASQNEQFVPARGEGFVTVVPDARVQEGSVIPRVGGCSSKGDGTADAS